MLWALYSRSSQALAAAIEGCNLLQTPLPATWQGRPHLSHSSYNCRTSLPFFDFQSLAVFERSCNENESSVVMGTSILLASSYCVAWQSDAICPKLPYVHTNRHSEHDWLDIVS